MLNYLGDTLYRSPHNSTHQAGNLKTGIDLIFEEQPYLANVYPGDTRRIGIVFTVPDMEIEYFSLGVNPIFSETYRIGSGIIRTKGFFITDACIGCGKCAAACPQRAIDAGKPSFIHQEHCLHCGNCFEI